MTERPPAPATASPSDPPTVDYSPPMPPPDLPRRRRKRGLVRTGVPAESVELDELDRQIVAILQADGRRSYASIAKQVGVSEGTARFRVQRLVDSSLLQIVGIADPLRLGFGTMAMVGIRVSPGFVQQVCSELVDIPETSYVVMATGRFDIFAELVCRDLSSFTRILTERISTIGGVVAAESFVLLEIHKLAYGWGVGEVDVALEDE